MMHRLIPLLALPLLVSCEVPIDTITDSDAYTTPAPGTYIGGSIEVLDGITSEPGGAAILFVFDCDNPPPPVGTGSPIDVVVVAESDFTAGQASFTVPGVPAESCSLLTGYIDRDRDFDLFYSITAQPTAGDLAFTSQTVVIGAASATGWVDPAENVLLRAEQTLLLDKPAFDAVFRGAPPPEETPEGILFEFDIGTLGTQFVELYTRDLSSEIQDVDSTAFTVIFAPDLDENGLPDDLSGTGFADLLSPTIVLRKLDDSDPTGLTLDADNPIIVPMAGLPFEPPLGMNAEWGMLAKHIELGLPFDGVSGFTNDRLLVAMRELILIDRATRTTQSIEDFELETGRDVTGTYQMMVMNSTGQLWTIPNEVAAFGHIDQGLRVRINRGE
jgi:hypothetical protein